MKILPHSRVMQTPHRDNKYFYNVLEVAKTYIQNKNQSSVKELEAMQEAIKNNDDYNVLMIESLKHYNKFYQRWRFKDLTIIF